MFQSKNKKKITVPTIETTQVTVPTLQGIATAGASAVEAARHWGEERLEDASEWAQPRLEQGQKAVGAAGAVAAARAAKGNERLSDLVDQAKDKGEQARSDAADRRNELAGRLRKETKKTRKQNAKARKQLAKKVSKKTQPQKSSGGFLSGLFSVLGILAVAGAAAAYYAKKQAQPKEDPWARPLTDPYVAPAKSTTAPGTTTAPAPSPATTSTTGVTDTTVDATVAAGTDTPPATVDDKDIVDLSAGGLPPESDVEARDASNTTLGDAVRDDRHQG